MGRFCGVLILGITNPRNTIYVLFQVSVDDITACQQQLFELKHSGAKLKKLYEARLTGYEGYYGAKLELRGPTIWRTECMNE